MTIEKANIDSFVERWFRFRFGIENDFMHIGSYLATGCKCNYKMFNKSKLGIVYGGLSHYTFFYNTEYED